MHFTVINYYQGQTDEVTSVTFCYGFVFILFPDLVCLNSASFFVSMVSDQFTHLFLFQLIIISCVLKPLVSSVQSCLCLGYTWLCILFSLFSCVFSFESIIKHLCLYSLYAHYSHQKCYNYSEFSMCQNVHFSNN